MAPTIEAIWPGAPPRSSDDFPAEDDILQISGVSIAIIMATTKLHSVPNLRNRAYEIKYHWGEEPPPPEIVENLTAKGETYGKGRLRISPSQGLVNLPCSRMVLNLQKMSRRPQRLEIMLKLKRQVVEADTLQVRTPQSYRDFASSAARRFRPNKFVHLNAFIEGLL